MKSIVLIVDTKQRTEKNLIKVFLKLNFNGSKVLGKLPTPNTDPLQITEQKYFTKNRIDNDDKVGNPQRYNTGFSS